MEASVEARLQDLEGRMRRLEAAVAPPKPFPVAPQPAPLPPRPPESPRGPQLDLEELLGGRVLAWVGGAAVVLGVVFFLALAIHRGWIDEPTRVALAFAGGYQSLRDRGLEAFVLETHLRYLQPARFDDKLVVHTRCDGVRGARFRFDYAIVRDGETVADGWTSHACVDRATLRPARVPEWLADAIATAESSSASSVPARSSSSA